MSNVSNSKASANAESSNKTQDIVYVSSDELPISCPLPNDEVWNKHPRVYIPLHQVDEYKCPYCSRLFKLIRDENKT